MSVSSLGIGEEIEKWAGLLCLKWKFDVFEWDGIKFFGDSDQQEKMRGLIEAYKLEVLSQDSASPKLQDPSDIDLYLKEESSEKKEEMRSGGSKMNEMIGFMPSEMQQHFMKFDEEDLKLKMENALAYVNNEIKTLKSSLLKTKENIAHMRKK